MTLRSRSAAAAAAALVLCAPAVIIPGAEDRFVFGKMLVAAIAVGIGWCAPANGSLRTVVRWLLVAGAGVLVLSALASPHPGVALLGRGQLNEGVCVLPIYLAAGMLGARLLGPGRRVADESRVLLWMTACALLVGVVAALEVFGLRPLSSDAARPGSLLGNASDQGAFAVLYLGPLVMAGLRRRTPVVIGGAGAAAATVLLSGSRGALLGMAVVLVLAGVVAHRRTRIGIAVALGLGGLVIFAVPAVRDRVLGLTPLAAHTVSGRIQLWRESLALFAHHPLLGVGPSQFENAIVTQHDAAWYHQVGASNPPATPHNLLLQALLSGGPLALVVLVALAVVLVRAAVAVPARTDGGWALGILFGLAGYAVALMFHFPTPGTVLPAVFLAGSVLAQPAPRAVPLRSIRWLVVAAAIALSVVFGCASIAEVYLHRGDQALASGDIAAADRAYSVAYALRPWDPDLPGGVLHAWVAAATSGTPAALPYADRWDGRVASISDDEQVAQNRAALQLAHGDPSRAWALLERALAADSENPQMVLLAGVIRGGLGDTAGAEAYFLDVTVLEPTNPAPWRDLAIAYRSQGRIELAQHADQRAQELAR